MSRKNKRTGKPKGLSNSQVNFMLAQAMRSGAFKRIADAAKAGASKEELKTMIVQQYSPNARPGLEDNNNSSFLAGHLDKLADQLIERYRPKDSN